LGAAAPGPDLVARRALLPVHVLSRSATAILSLALAGPAARAAETGGADFDTLRVSRLECVIGNNAAAAEHRAGYNGIFRLTAPGGTPSAFVPAFSGLNLEHYFDGRLTRGNPQVTFEPRVSPMLFRRLGPTTAELFQAATPVYGVESRTVFELREPYYLDVTYRAKPRAGGFHGGFLGVFWASYINGPHDKSIYFLDGSSTLAAPRWVQFTSQVHGRDATVRAADDRQEFVMEPDPRSLPRNFSPLRYGAPFFYGRFHDQVLIYIFRPSPFLRFAHSPSGGSRNAAGDDTNPAWDFQLVVPEAEALQGLQLELRLVYKPWAGRDDVLREVRSWLGAAGESLKPE
jgi:hypothetical protein